MANKPTPAAQMITLPMNEALLDEDRQAQNALATLGEQDLDNTRALAKQLSYTGPLDPDALEQICYGKALAVERSTFEFGASLLLLRESCLHGDWQQRMQRIGIEPRAAQKYMQIALKFSNAPSTAHLAMLGKTKLLELVVLDDSEVSAFAAGETVRGIRFDDAERLSVKELRAALKEAEAENKAAKQVAADAAAKNLRLEHKLKRIQNAEPEKIISDTLAECTKRAHETLGYIRGDLRLGFTALAALEDNGNTSHRGVMAGWLVDMRRELDILAGDFFLFGEKA